ncbi:FAD/NAD(P)-binding domain-containing protein [Glonium stellatum]|uniref:FAD/NAD(P)-binding domain-containing protein n=1 Tax=Glonium stellatum TaxID=574774 RepID=A0A8E2F5L8_9PEZI|nr:FAD/NAD(P)-binding domain-containing protein [Glonium stellatum]
MKSVLIVGAGPSGLVAAKTLLHSTPGKFNITVLEQQDRVGGMWALRKGEMGGKFNPEMPTNLSRFTVAFSDLSWNSVDLDGEADEIKGKKKSDHMPIFPKAWQVGRYLETYAKKYIPKDIIHLNSRVTKAERIMQDGVKKWKVKWKTLRISVENTSIPQKAEGPLFDRCYDYLIVGSGFFSSPRPLALEKPEDGIDGPPFLPKLQHSSEFVDLETLLPKGSDANGNIVVIGGGISGSEVAANVAFQISNAKYAPLSKQTYANCNVYHVFSRPFYCLPRYLPQDPYSPETQSYKLAPTFCPLDFCMYNLSRRSDGPIFPMHGRVPPKTALKSHQFIRSVLGGDQRDLGHPEVVYNQQQQEFPPYNGLVDRYSEFIRSGSIIPISGRAIQLGTSTNEPGAPDQETIINKGTVKALSQLPWDVYAPNECSINDVIGIIYATGFSPRSSIDWLSEEVLRALEYDENANRLPLLLQRHSIFNNRIPELAFIGFYEGPFWGVMEMQARLVAKKWASQDESAISPRMSASEASKEEIDAMRNLRNAMIQHCKDVPQFWMGDYVGFIEGLAQELGMERNDSGFNGRKGPCIAARYTDSGCDQSQAEEIVHDLKDMMEASFTQARFVAAAAFRAMQGAWILRRKLDSRLAGFPSGIFKGTANFHPRYPTDLTFAAEYLYVEEGVLTTDTGFTLNANRRYVYRYDEASDKISAWFVKDDGKTVDYFFNEMQFQLPNPDTKAQGKGWIAKGAHLCEQDMYESLCEFRFRGASLDTFGIIYEVKGPKKDYTSESWYER